MPSACPGCDDVEGALDPADSDGSRVLGHGATLVPARGPGASQPAGRTSAG